MAQRQTPVDVCIYIERDRDVAMEAGEGKLLNLDRRTSKPEEVRNGDSSTEERRRNTVCFHT